MTCQLVEGLIAELDCAETDPGISLRLGRMQLAHGDDRLAVVEEGRRNSGQRGATREGKREVTGAGVIPEQVRRKRGEAGAALKSVG